MRRLARVTQQLLLALLCAVILSIGWSSVAQAEVALACAEEMKNNPVVDAAIQDAWEDSLVNNKDKRHEEGGWILQNIETGELAVVRVPSGTRAELILGDPPSKEGWRVVGFFHTHPSPPIDEFGYMWEPGPSDADNNFARSWGLPGLIRNRDGTLTFGPRCPPTPKPTPPTPKPGLGGEWVSRVPGTGYVLEWLNGPFTWYYDVVLNLTQSGNTITCSEKLTLRNVVLTPGQEAYGGVQEQFQYWKSQLGTTSTGPVSCTVSGNTISIHTNVPGVIFSLTYTGDKLYGITTWSGVGINYRSTFDLKRK